MSRAFPCDVVVGAAVSNAARSSPFPSQLKTLAYSFIGSIMETWKADGTGAKLLAQMDQLEISCPVTDQMSGLKGADLKADGIIVTLRDRLLIQTDLL